MIFDIFFISLLQKFQCFDWAQPEYGFGDKTQQQQPQKQQEAQKKKPTRPSTPYQHTTLFRVKKWATEAEIEKIDDDMVDQVSEAVELADKADYPSADELYTDVYVEPYPYIIE